MSFIELRYTFCAGIVALIIVISRLYNVGQRPKGYPPGPPTLPFVDNLHQIPSEKRHLQFEKWAREYRPIYSLMLGTKVMIVLNSDEAVKELVERRGAIYSSRPESCIAQDVLSGGLRILFTPNNGLWKMARKLGQHVLGVTAARTYVPYQDLENKAMLLGFLENPERRPCMTDRRFKQAFEISDQSSEMIGSLTAAMLDLVPVLRNIPDFLLPTKKDGRDMHRKELSLFRELFLKTKEGLKLGMVRTSWFNLALCGLVVTVVAGPGTFTGLAWLFREEILVTRRHKDAVLPSAL